MKARITIPGTAGSAKLTVVSCATLMVLVSAAVSACTGPSSSSVPAIFSSPGTTGTHTGTATATSPESGHTATATASGTPTSTATSTATSTPTPTPATTSPSAQPPTPTTTTYYPTAAPQTGGGGTAGLQNGLAIGLGGTAIVAGLGGLAYRRKLTRRR
jgi:hypothetical protein